MVKFLQSKWRLAARAIPVLILIGIVKAATHYFGLEFLELSAIFTALISANIFLIGFNISGVLSDFKEGEKLPGELASNIEAIADECVYIHKSKGAADGKNGFIYCIDFTKLVLKWLYNKARTKQVMEKIAGFTDIFLAFDTLSQTSFISRLKHEQSEIRKAVMRIHAIREVRFSAAAYAIAEIITAMIIMGMVFLKMAPFYQNMFFTLFISFVFIYMLFLIRDLDDPFAYYDQKHSVEEISLHSLEDLEERLKKRRAQLE